MEEIVSSAEPPAASQLSPDGSPPLLESAVPRSPSTLGPWYHTLGIVLLLLAYSSVAHILHRAPAGSGPVSEIERRVTETAQSIADAPKVPLYCSTVMLSWMLLASVVAGLYRRRAFFTVTLGRRFPSRWTDPAIGLGIYLAFLAVVSTCIFVLTAVLTLRTHTTHATSADSASAAQSHTAPSTSGNDDADSPHSQEQAQAVQQRVQRILHFDQQAVASLAPRTLPEMLLWIGLSFTAGFCEEHIFRGYLLSQALAVMRRLAAPAWLASTLSVLATSMLFGSLHLYEGVGGAVMIGLLGAVFATMTLVLGNLRAVIIAHFLQDFFGGLIFYIAHLRHTL